MNTEDEILLTRFLDGELAPSERDAFEIRLLKDAALSRFVEGQQELGDVLRTALPASLDVPHGDFFQSQLMRRIYEEAEVAKRSASSAARFWGWLGRPWGAALAGAATCALLMLVFFSKSAGEATATDQLADASGYVPGAGNGIQVNGYYVAEASATVVMIEGLPELPSNSQIGGFRFNVPNELRVRMNQTGANMGHMSRVAEASTAAVSERYRVTP